MRSVLANLPDPPDRALALHTEATLTLAQLLLERGEDREAAAHLLTLDAYRDRLFHHAAEAAAPLATLLAQVYADRSQPDRAAAIAGARAQLSSQP